MKSILPLLALTCMAASSFAEVKVTVQEISDRRTTGKFFAGLEVQLLLSGPELLDAKGIRMDLKSAIGQDGKELARPESRINDEGAFGELERDNLGASAGDDKTSTTARLKLEFTTPPRNVSTITSLTGLISLLVPKNDPQSIVTASVAKDAEKILGDGALKAAGVEIKLLKPSTDAKKADGFTVSTTLGDHDLGYEIKDPNNKVAAVEFFTTDGRKLNSNSRMTTGFQNAKSVVQSYEQKPPPDAVARIYLVTPKSIVTIPLDLKDIVLP